MSSWPWQPLLTIQGKIVFVVADLGSIENIFWKFELFIKKSALI